jgi:hypothetical protein
LFAQRLNVVHTEKDGNTYANIEGASPLPKGMVAPEMVNEKRLIDINCPWDEINALPDFILFQWGVCKSEAFR